MDKMVHTMTEKEKEKIDKRVSEYFYATLTPFNRIEHKTFKRMVRALRQPYHPPSRKQLGGKLLNQSFKEVININ